MTSLSDNTRGALLMMLSMAAFTLGDTCMKFASGSLPLGQLLGLRAVVSTLVLVFIARHFGALRFDLPRREWGLIALRCFGEVASAYFFFLALFQMPIANVTALMQMLPLTLTLGSAVFFAEPVGWRRWVAIAIGFAGMLMIVRPGTEGFNEFSISALVAVMFVTLRDLVTRRMSPATPSLLVTLCASGTVLVFAMVLSLSEDWQPLTPQLGLLVLAASVFIIIGYLCSVLVMRVGQISFVAPFRYTGLIWALILGWLVFGEWPVPLTFLGAGIIIATGGFTLVREAQLRRRRTRDQAKTLRT